MKTVSLNLFFLLSIAFHLHASDKIKYLDTLSKMEDMKVKVIDGVSTDEIVKAKLQFENKNDYFVILNPTKTYYYVNGSKFYSKDREIIIPPSGKRSKVIDARTMRSQAKAISLVLDGLSKTTNEKTIEYPQIQVKNDNRFFYENVDVMIVDVDYDGDKTHLKIKVKNTGNDILILNSSVIELLDQTSSLNNIRKRTNKVLLKKGETEVIIVSFQSSNSKNEKLLVWNDAFVTASLEALPPIEIVLCEKPSDLINYKPLQTGTLVKSETPPQKAPVTTKSPETTKPKPAAVQPEKKQEPAVKSAVVTTEPARNTGSGDRELHATEIDFGNSEGKFYALLIGISDYTDPEIPDLDGLPVKDALSLEKVLVSNYLFNKEDVVVLQSPTRREIVIALDNLAKKVTDLDNVLIFYAGHGHYEDDNDIGYWLPKDAEVSNSSNWLYNDQLVAGLRKIKSLHTLLISDACFSGSIFKSRSVSFVGASEVIKKKYQLPSRKAITSGTLKTVPNKSVFLKYLLDRLEKNTLKYYSASNLYQDIEQPVGNNSSSLPQFGVIQNVGDEGGDFIFIKR